MKPRKTPARRSTSSPSPLDAITLARAQFVPIVHRLTQVYMESNNPMAVAKAAQLLCMMGRYDQMREPVHAEINLVKVNMIDETGGGGFTGIPELSADELRQQDDDASDVSESLG